MSGRIYNQPEQIFGAEREFFNDDPVALWFKANEVVEAAKSLRSIKDTKLVPLWDEYVPEEQIVSKMWKQLVEQFDKDNKVNNIRADIEYDRFGPNEDDIFTSIRVTLINDKQREVIQQANETQLKNAL